MVTAASKEFILNDTIVIRFRLHSDLAGHGWGWAIDNIEIQNENTTAIDPISGVSQFNIYPNPTSGDQISVVLELENGSRAIGLQLFDMSGKLLYNRDTFIFGGPNNKILELDISSLKAGIYCITLLEDNSLSTKRFVVSRN